MCRNHEHCLVYITYCPAMTGFFIFGCYTAGRVATTEHMNVKLVHGYARFKNRHVLRGIVSTCSRDLTAEIESTRGMVLPVCGSFCP